MPTPNNFLQAGALAAKFDLMVISDMSPRSLRKSQYFPNDEAKPAADIIRTLQPAHWVVARAPEHPRLVPKGGI